MAPPNRFSVVTLLLLVLWVTESLAAPDLRESMFLLRWETGEAFYSQWAQQKEQAAVQKRDNFPREGLLMEGLLQSHTHQQEGRRELLHPPEKVYTLDRSNAAWLERAVAFCQQERWKACRDALERLSSPMDPAHQSQAHFLHATLQMRSGKDTAAEQGFAAVAIDSPLWPLAQYNRILVQLRHSRLKEAAQALEDLEDWIDDQDQSQQPLSNRILFLDARLQARQGDQRKASRQLERIKADHPLHFLALHGELDLKQQTGDDQEALPALLQLSQRSGKSLLVYHQVALLNTLERLGASRQVLSLGEGLLPSLVDSLGESHTLASHLSSELFFTQLLAGTLDEEGTQVEQRLSREVTLMVAEIRRLADLRRLLTRTLELLPAYQPMFDKGIGHITALIDLHPNLKPPRIYRLPSEVAGTERADFEQDLSNLVGQPDRWDDRYEIFRGMTLWESGHRPPWLRGSQVDYDAAAGTLDAMVEKRQKLVRRLSRQLVTESAVRMRDLTQRTQTMLDQLNDLNAMLRPQLRELLRHEARRMTRGIEQQVLWLANRTLLKPAEIDNPAPQPRFTLSVNGRGRVSVSTLETPAEVLPSPNAYAALELLGEEALNPEIRNRALRHLADLHLASAERRMLTGEADASGFAGSFERASTFYQQLLDTQGAQPADPVVLLYQLAHAYSLEGKPEAALTALERLDSAYPDHPDADETLFRIAETRFSLGDYEQAARRYASLLQQWPQSSLAIKARHKLGWSQFKLGEYQLALDQLLPLLEQHWNQPTENPSLVEDLLRVSAMSFSHLGGIARLEAHFNTGAASQFEQALVEQLAAYLEEKERFSDAAAAYDRLLARFPASDAAPDYQAGLVRIYTQGGFTRLVWPAREAFVERFGVDSTYWQQADADQRRRIGQHLADYLVLLARRYHASAQASADEDEKAQAYDRTLHWYRQFIEALPEHPQVALMWFLRGEALTETDRHREAAEAYARAGYDYPAFERRVEAAYAELLAYQSLYQGNDDEDKAAWLQRGIDRSRHFIDAYPQAEQTPEVLTKLAEDLLIQDDNAQALEIALRLSRAPAPTDPTLSLRLWRVVAHSAFNLEQYAQAEQGYLQARRLSPPLDELKAFTKRLAESIFKQGEQAREAGEQAQAVDHFLRLRRQVPDSPILPEAEFEAARLLMESERWQEAITQLLDFRQRFPNHDLQATIPDKLVIAFEQTDTWDRAAFELQRIFEREGASPLGRDALWRSASLQEKAGDPLRAAIGYERYVEAFPTPLDTRLEAFKELLRLAENPAVKRDPNDLRRAIIAAHEEAGAQATARSRFLASEASLELARQAKLEYDGIALTLPLDRSLARKKAAMERSIEGLTRTTGYGLAEHATAATALIGEIYAELARALMGSERPTELDDLAQEQYDILLEEEAIPFEDKAIDLHELNLDRIQQGVFTPAMAESLRVLRRMMPARYEKNEVVDEVIDEMQ